MSVATITCPFCSSESFKFSLNQISMFLCHCCQRYLSWEMAEKFRKTETKTSESIFVEVDYSSLLKRSTQINTLPSEHKAKMFLTERQIPSERLNDLYYTDDFNQFLQGTKYEDKFKSKPQIIIPLRSKKGMFGVQARSLDNEGPKYTTIKFVECATIFGKDRVNTDWPITVVEGPFDSMFVDNSIAVTGSGTTKIDFEGDFIYCFDNEPRNKSIVKQMETHLMKGDKVVIWPDKLKQKDINDMVRAGVCVNSVINENIWQGAKGQVRLSMWKKV